MLCIFWLKWCRMEWAFGTVINAPASHIGVSRLEFLLHRKLLMYIGRQRVTSEVPGQNRMLARGRVRVSLAGLSLQECLESHTGTTPTLSQPTRMSKYPALPTGHSVSTTQGAAALSHSLHLRCLKAQSCIPFLKCSHPTTWKHLLPGESVNFLPWLIKIIWTNPRPQASPNQIPSSLEKHLH